MSRKPKIKKLINYLREKFPENLSAGITRLPDKVFFEKKNGSSQLDREQSIQKLIASKKQLMLPEFKTQITTQFSNKFSETPKYVVSFPKLLSMAGFNAWSSHRSSQYKQKLENAKKMRFLYGSISRKDLKKVVEQANRFKEKQTSKLLELISARLDIIVYRAGFCANLFSAKQMIREGLVTVNGVAFHSEKHLVQPGDIIKIVVDKKNARFASKQSTDRTELETAIIPNRSALRKRFVSQLFINKKFHSFFRECFLLHKSSKQSFKKQETILCKKATAGFNKQFNLKKPLSRFKASNFLIALISLRCFKTIQTSCLLKSDNFFDTHFDKCFFNNNLSSTDQQAKLVKPDLPIQAPLSLNSFPDSQENSKLSKLLLGSKICFKRSSQKQAINKLRTKSEAQTGKKDISPETVSGCLDKLKQKHLMLYLKKCLIKASLFKSEEINKAYQEKANSFAIQQTKKLDHEKLIDKLDFQINKLSNLVLKFKLKRKQIQNKALYLEVSSKRLCAIVLYPPQSIFLNAFLDFELIRKHYLLRKH